MDMESNTTGANKMNDTRERLSNIVNACPFGDLPSLKVKIVNTLQTSTDEKLRTVMVLALNDVNRRLWAAGGVHKCGAIDCGFKGTQKRENGTISLCEIHAHEWDSQS